MIWVSLPDGTCVAGSTFVMLLVSASGEWMVFRFQSTEVLGSGKADSLDQAKYQVCCKAMSLRVISNANWKHLTEGLNVGAY